MRILNLYAGVGGNRRLWDGHDITAVELDPDIAAVYRDRHPDDELIVGDAHTYLLEHHQEFDFIWSSPPCQTHTQWRRIDVKVYGSAPNYPDMKLYQEILFLQHMTDALWVVENVIPYYEPLIEPTARIHRHLYWANFTLPTVTKKQTGVIRNLNKISELEDLHGIDLSAYKLPNKRQILRNCVDAEVASAILNRVEGGDLEGETDRLAATLF